MIYVGIACSDILDELYVLNRTFDDLKMELEEV